MPKERMGQIVDIVSRTEVDLPKRVTPTQINELRAASDRAQKLAIVKWMAIHGGNLTTDDSDETAKEEA